MVTKTLICGRCGASFVPESPLQKTTKTCKECERQIVNCLPNKKL